MAPDPVPAADTARGEPGITSTCLVAPERPLDRLLTATPVFYGGKYRSTTEWLQFARRNPTKIAAWALRDVIDELLERRADGLIGAKPPEKSRGISDA